MNRAFDWRLEKCRRPGPALAVGESFVLILRRPANLDRDNRRHAIQSSQALQISPPQILASTAPARADSSVGSDALRPDRDLRVITPAAQKTNHPRIGSQSGWA